MNRTQYTLIIITALLLSCNNKPESSNIPKTYNSDHSNQILLEGIRELALYKKENEFNSSNTSLKFPSSDCTLIKAYELDCKGEYNYAPFKNRKSHGIEISNQEFDDLISLLENPSSYSNPTAACFNPKIGIVIYNHDQIPVEYLSICLNCNNYRSGPGDIDVSLTNDHLKGFSQSARDSMRKRFSSWGIDYYGFSMLWDDTVKYKTYLDQKNLTY